MERSYKVPWYMILSIAILFGLLSHTRRLLTHFQMEGDQLLSNFIIYAGIPLFILILISMFFLKRHFPVSNTELFRDKIFLILFIIMVLLGIGMAF